MARFKGDSSGRNIVQYAQARVDAACSDLCTHVNNEVNSLNTNKLSTSGSGANLTNVVHSITAGSGLSVNQSTGAVTIDASSSGASGSPQILYQCTQCWNGTACIPSDKRGVFAHYEIMGQTNRWHQYCSSWAGCWNCAPGCYNNPFGGYCCNACACGWIGANKCFYSTRQYDCAGVIPWMFGCSSDCYTACSYQGMTWHTMIMPENPCNYAEKGYRYCFSTSNNGDSTLCCMGVRNAGRGYVCCGQAPGCLKCFCYTTQGATSGFGGHHTSVTVIGYGKLPI